MPNLPLRKWIGLELVATSPREKLVATLGGGLSIYLLILLTHWAIPGAGASAVIAPMGASAVLLFAVPHGPLSQPWPVVVGHVLPAFIGVACAKFISAPTLAASCAVGLSIGAMQQLKCIHPPGGATALTAVIGGDSIHQLGYHFVLIPVLANALLMVGLAVAINFVFPWRRYPTALHRPPTPIPPTPTPPSHEEIITALKSIDSFVDISEEDLIRLVEQLQHIPATRPKA